MFLPPRAFTVLLAATLSAACSTGPTHTCPGAKPCLPLSFPAKFDFGFATVAYQSEGSTALDGGRVQSNWAEWEDLGGPSEHQTNPFGNGFRDGYAQDLGLSASLGANSFSYALDWARIEPAPGVFDEAEIKRAVDIVKAMRERKLRPLVVLFHWVSPNWVQSPKTGLDMLAQPDLAFVDAFIPFAQRMVPELAGLVDDWVTLEEPMSVVMGEYLSGQHPPGHTLDFNSSYRALKNLAYLHARTYKTVHALDTTDADGDGVAAFVGIENLAFDVVPLDGGSADDVKATAHIDYMLNHQFMKAITSGDLDLDMDGKITNVRFDPPERHDDELAHTVDFIGLNYYQELRVEKGGLFTGVAPLYATPHYDVREYDVNVPHSDLYQEFSAQALRRVIEAYAVYKVPLVVSENGLADGPNDRLPFYLMQQLYEIGRAIADGYDIRGYYFWTISDNFEWWEGHAPRFGIYRVDWTSPMFPRTRTRACDVYEAIAKSRKIDQALWNTWALEKYPAGPP